MILALLALSSNAAVHTPAVRPAIAMTAPERWFVADDYQRSPRAIPKTLTTGVKLTIDTSGRVEHCVVTSPSLWPALDPEICRILMQTRFEPDSGVRGTTSAIDLTWTPPRVW
jgi:hypothetical protein